MACSLVWVSDYLNGKLQPQEERIFESHLDSCIACRGILEEQAAEEGFWVETKSALNEPLDSTIPPADVRRLANSLRLAFHGSSKIDLASFEEELNAGWKHWLGPATMENSIGRVLKYEILSIIGQGGMGIVFRAVDTELNRIVALKTLSAEARFHGDSRLRLLREARATALLSHPNIIPIFAFETWAGVPFIVSPFVPGGNLHDYVSSNDLPIEQLLEMAVQVTEALAVLHENGVIHRDLKPTNILVNQETQQLILCDFGLARIESDNRITDENAIAGTPFFMSPEQALGIQIDTRSDLFSLGSLIYWLLSKQYPFTDRTKLGVLKQIVDHDPVVLSSFVPNIPSAVQQIVQGLLIKERDLRLGPARRVAELLRNSLAKKDEQHLPIVTGDAAAAAAKENEAVRKPRSRGVSFILVGMIMAGALLGSALWWNATHQIDVGIYNDTMNSSHKDIRSESRSNASNSDGALVSIPNTEASEHSKTEIEDTIPFEDLGLPLSNLERATIPEELKQGKRTKRWLRRLSKMPTQLIPAEIVELVVPFSQDENPELKNLADLILSKSPFEVVSETNESVFGHAKTGVLPKARIEFTPPIDHSTLADPFIEPHNPFQEVPDETNSKK
ncbi:MAG: protein kinase domain-containing protein [Pirellula sp.]